MIFSFWDVSVQLSTSGNPFLFWMSPFCFSESRKPLFVGCDSGMLHSKPHVLLRRFCTCRYPWSKPVKFEVLETLRFPSLRCFCSIIGKVQIPGLLTWDVAHLPRPDRRISPISLQPRPLRVYDPLLWLNPRTKLVVLLFRMGDIRYRRSCGAHCLQCGPQKSCKLV